MPPSDLRFRLIIGAGVGLWFAICYAGADYLMRGQTDLPSTATALDALIPFWPWWAIAYLSVTPFLCLPLLVLPARSDLITLALTLCAEITIAAAVFMAFPVASPPLPPGPYPAVLVLADAVNLGLNNLPSLHVALTVATLLAIRPHLGQLKTPVTLWAILICGSTLLTHQHDITSVAAGLALALTGHAVFRHAAFRHAAFTLAAKRD